MTKKTKQINKLTYEITAQTHQTPNISYKRPNLTEHQAHRVISILSTAIREACIICEQTGEVMCNYYYSDEWFTPLKSPVAALYEAEEYIINTKEND